jgi:hypothetical protein
MLLSLIVNSAFGLKAETLSDCPNNSLGHQFNEAVSLSGCHPESPTPPAGTHEDPAQWLLINYAGTDLIEISHSTFRDFPKPALSILSLGAVTLTGLLFQGFVNAGSNLHYAVSVAGASELYGSGLTFSDFTDCGALGDSDSGGAKEMLSLFDLTMTNVNV